MPNPFTFLADSDDEDVTPKQVVQTKKTETKPKAAPAKKSENKSNNKDNRGPKNSGRPNRRQGDRRQQGDRQQGDRPRRDRAPSDRKGYAGRNGREFDRKSGTGRSGPGAVQRKDGSGKGNWGSNTEMINSADADQEAVTKEIAAEGDEPTEEPVAEPEPEEEDNEMTLEEYQAKLLSERANSDAFKTLKPRAIETDFGGAAILKKQEEEDFTSSKAKNFRKKNKQTKNVASLDVKLNYARSDDSGREERGKGKGKGGGFRGRGEARGGKGKGKGGGGFRGNKGGPRNLNVDDAAAFPTLG